jgi:DNA-binding phage protein
MSTKRTDPKFDKAFDRAALRTAFVSTFWAVIEDRKKRRGGFTMTALAKAVGSSKHEVSRWFNGSPNWTLNTIANIANALGLEIVVSVRERSTGRVFTPAGLQVSPNSQRLYPRTKTVAETSTSFMPPTRISESPPVTTTSEAA